MILRIENNFDAMLSAIAWCFRNNKKPDEFVTGNDCPLLTETIFTEPEPDIVNTFHKNLSARINPASAAEIMHDVWCAWLSEIAGIEMKIYNYLYTAIKMAYDPAGRTDLPEISAVVKAVRKANAMAHYYLGILRFQLINSNDEEEIYLADIEPDCNILPLIIKHFSERFYDQNFVIRDLRRSFAVYHKAHGKTSLFEFDLNENTQLPAVSLGKSDYMSEMWSDYLNHLTIPERKNQKLQNGNLPKKYRKHMTDFKPEN